MKFTKIMISTCTTPRLRPQQNSPLSLIASFKKSQIYNEMILSGLKKT